MYIFGLVLQGTDLIDWLIVAGTWMAAIGTILAVYVALSLGNRAEMAQRDAAQARAKEQEMLQIRRSVALAAGVANEVAHAIPRLIAADLRLHHITSQGVENREDKSKEWREWAVDQYQKVLFSIEQSLPLTARMVDHAEVYDSESAKLACALIAQLNGLIASVRSLATGHGFLDTRTNDGLHRMKMLRANLEQVRNNAYATYIDAFRKANIDGDPLTIEQFGSGVFAG